MSKKTKKNNVKAKKASHHNKVKAAKPFPWFKWLRKGAIAAVFIGLIGTALTVYSNKVAIEHDLSVVGNGTPTVVQIHDPGCQLCQSLKSNLDSVKNGFTDQVQFKTANIKTKKGRRFAQGHGVQHVTLLFFDGQGQRVHTLEGVTPKETIRSTLESFVNRTL